MMRTIIAGGTGLIGRALAESLIGDGHEVTILSRSPEKARDLPAGVDTARWDGKTAEGWGHLVEGADAILNLAGYPLPGEGFLPARWTPEIKKLINDSRTLSGEAVVAAVEAAKKKPGVVVQASAIGYYAAGDARITDDSPRGSDFQAQVCSNWEQATEPVEAQGVRRVIIRTGLPLSTKGGVLPRLLLPFKLFAGGPLGDGTQWMPWIHIKDMIGAIRFLMENPDARGPFIVSNPTPVRNKDFAQIAGRVLKRPSFIPAPAFAFKLAFGEVSTVILDGWQAYPERLSEAGYNFQFTNLEAALRDLVR